MNALRVALRIISGKIIYNFGVQESLRTFLNPIFTGGGVAGNGICSAAFCESAALRVCSLPRGSCRAATEGVTPYNKKETTAQKLCNGFFGYCIKQSEQDQTSSRTAISAASPRRAPILMMRV